MKIIVNCDDNCYERVRDAVCASRGYKEGDQTKDEFVSQTLAEMLKQITVGRETDQEVEAIKQKITTEIATGLSL